MKKIVLKSFILLFLLSLCFNANSQSIKKAFIELFENDRYISAFDIFRSKEYLNTSPGKYGIAYIYFYKDIDYQGYSLKLSTKYEPYYRKAFAYSDILKAEELLPEVSDKDKKKLADYFSEQKILNLKKSMENYFLETEHKEFKIIFDSLRSFSKGNTFCTALENRFIKYEFENIKKTDKKSVWKLSKTEKLIKKFPGNENITILIRYADSIRFLQAKTIKDYSIILKKYPDIHLKQEIIKKIKGINKDYQSKIFKNKTLNTAILVTEEIETEEKAIELLADRYYRYYSENKYSSPPKFHYTELSDEEVKKYNINHKYLIYLYLASSDQNFYLETIDTYKYRYNNCYVLDPDYEVQIFSKDTVYKTGQLLNTYQAISFLPTGKYTISPTEFESSKLMRKIFNDLQNQKKYLIYNVFPGDYIIKIYPDENPFPIKYNLKYNYDFDWNKDAVHVFFFSNTKKPIHFELEQKNFNNAVTIIMKKAELYFTDQ